MTSYLLSMSLVSNHISTNNQNSGDPGSTESATVIKPLQTADIIWRETMFLRVTQSWPH